MHSFHLAAVKAYSSLATPLQRVRLRHLAAQSVAPISVLFYHRVADRYPNAWTMTQESFRRQMEYCREHLELIDLAELQRRIGERDSCAPATSITFDDGYRDNCDFAIPYLLEHKIPATYFVTTTNIRNQSVFPHDARAGVPLPVNSVTEIREMSDAGIEIGCHTRHHVDFGRVTDPGVVRNEIVDAKDELEQMIGKPVRFFAFPFGMPEQLTQMAIESVAEAGYKGFCSAFGSYNLVGRDTFHIRRLHGDPVFARVKRWLSYEPRKVHHEPDIRYFLPPHKSFELSVAAMTPHTPNRVAS